MPSLGQAERERAFQEWLAKEIKSNVGWLAMPGNAIARGKHLRTLLRYAFDAGVELGLDGCCHAHPDNGSRLAVKERDE